MNNVIYHRAKINCSPDVAFEHFINKNLLEKWLTSMAEIEANAGGKYELYWNPNDLENDSTIGCSITALQKPFLIAFEWKSPAQYKQFTNNADPLTHVVIVFSYENDHTNVDLIHSGWRSTPNWIEALNGRKKHGK